jgi:excisionase family DNA binding protein
MIGLSLREAAKEASVSKSTILRAVKAGRLSAARTDDGGYSIDPAELFRVYPPESRTNRPDRAGTGAAGHGAPAEAIAELRIQKAVLEAQLAALRDALDCERRRAEEIREERERWHTQANRLALMAPAAPAPTAKPAEPVSRPHSRFGWFRRRSVGPQARLAPAA